MGVLFFKAIPRPAIWGHTKVRDFFGYDDFPEGIGQSWSFSAQDGEGLSTVCINGEFKGKTLKELWEKHYIIRSSWIYSEFGHNFVKTMLRLAQSKPEIHVVSDQMGSPTYALELAKGIIHLISTVNAEDHDLFGTYHFANQGSSTWFDFAKEIFKIQNLQTNVLPITTADFNAAASRPHYSVLNCDKFTSTFDYKIPQWEDSLKQCLYKMPNK